MIFVNN